MNEYLVTAVKTETYEILIEAGPIEEAGTRFGVVVKIT